MIDSSHYRLRFEYDEKVLNVETVKGISVKVFLSEEHRIIRIRRQYKTAWGVLDALDNFRKRYPKNMIWFIERWNMSRGEIGNADAQASIAGSTPVAALEEVCSGYPLRERAGTLDWVYFGVVK